MNRLNDIIDSCFASSLEFHFNKHSWQHALVRNFFTLYIILWNVMECNVSNNNGLCLLEVVVAAYFTSLFLSYNVFLPPWYNAWSSQCGASLFSYRFREAYDQERDFQNTFGFYTRFPWISSFSFFACVTRAFGLCLTVNNLLLDSLVVNSRSHCHQYSENCGCHFNGDMVKDWRFRFLYFPVSYLKQV